MTDQDDADLAAEVAAAVADARRVLRMALDVNPRSRGCIEELLEVVEKLQRRNARQRHQLETFDESMGRLGNGMADLLTAARASGRREVVAQLAGMSVEQLEELEGAVQELGKGDDADVD